MDHTIDKLKYTCPMHPEVVKDNPGKCPICGMDLVPRGKGSNNLHQHEHSHKHDDPQQGHGQYYCPMYCEGDKKYDKPGDCPVCGMHLVRKDSKGLQDASNTTSLKPMPSIRKKKEGEYYCPMLCEGNKKYDKPGNCPVCGMHLVKEQRFENRPKEYTCPMHPEIIRTEPGSCPICGMDLVPRVVQKDNEEEDAAYKTMLRRFWIAVIFTVPVFVLAMGVGQQVRGD